MVKTVQPNAREQAFLLNYLKSFDPIGSFIAAGLKAKDKGGELAAAQAILLKYPDRLIELTAPAVSDDIELNGDLVIQELAALAFSNIGTACTWDERSIKLIPLDKLAPHQLAAIRKVNVKPGEFGLDISVEMHDKKGALNTLAKHFNVDSNLNDLISRIQSFGYEVRDRSKN